jgi:hypothetical protein
MSINHRSDLFCMVGTLAVASYQLDLIGRGNANLEFGSAGDLVLFEDSTAANF